MKGDVGMPGASGRLQRPDRGRRQATGPSAHVLDVAAGFFVNGVQVAGSSGATYAA